VARVLRTAYGPMRVTDDPADLIGRSLEQFGTWGAAEVDFVSLFLRNDEFLWDGGAHLGTFALGVQAKNAVRVLAIEANEDLVPLLIANLSANRAAATAVAHVALSARNGSVTATSAPPHNLGASRFEVTDEPSRPGGGTKAVTLRDMRYWHGDYTALKLDIEGAELEVLKGDADFIRASKPLLWVECTESTQALDLAEFFLWAGLDPVYAALPALPGTLDGISPEVCEGFLLGGWRSRMDALPVRDDPRGFLRLITSRSDLRQALSDTPRWADTGWETLGRSELVARLGRLVLAGLGQPKPEVSGGSMTQDTHTIVIVYQFGKVASTSLVNAIDRVAGYQAVHSHVLGVDLLEELVAYACNRHTSEYAAKVVIDQLDEAIQTTRLLDAVRNGTGPRKRIVLVTMVREPLAWFRSAFVQDLPRYMELLQGIGRHIGLQDPKEMDEALTDALRTGLIWLADVAERVQDLANVQWSDSSFREAVESVVPADLRQEFLSLFFVMVRPLGWFQDHYTKATGIGLEEFEPHRLGMWKRPPDWVHAYLIRYEDLEKGFLVLRDELGLPGEVTLPRDNVSQKKPHAEAAAAAFKTAEGERLRRALCNTPYARRFGYRAEPA
jgi:FkbM family methyltransferase